MTLERFGQVALPEGAVRDGEVIDEAAVAAQIRHLWSATGFSGKRVILGVGDRHVVVRQVELPAMSPAQLKKTLPFQVQDYLPMPVDQAVLDFHQTGAYTTESGEHVRGLLVAASRVGVMSAVQSVRAAGLRPVSVDLNSFALLRSVGAGPSQPGLTEAIVDVGARVTNLVVHTGGVPQIVRILFMGGQSVTEALSERVGMAPMEAEAFKQEFGVFGSAGVLGGVAGCRERRTESGGRGTWILGLLRQQWHEPGCPGCGLRGRFQLGGYAGEAGRCHPAHGRGGKPHRPTGDRRHRARREADGGDPTSGECPGGTGVGSELT